MAAAAVAGLILGLLLGIAALLSAVLACASRSESESLPLHTLQSTPPSTAAAGANKTDPPKPKDPQTATAKQPSDNKSSQQQQQQQQQQQRSSTKDASKPVDNNKGGNNAAKQPTANVEEWSGAKLWQEYVAKMKGIEGNDAKGKGGGGPQYVVFDPKSGKMELKPAPANDAPFLKICADGRVELVDAAGGGKGGGGKDEKKGQQQQQQQGQQVKKEEDQKQSGTEQKGNNNDTKKDVKNQEANKGQQPSAGQQQSKGEPSKSKAEEAKPKPADPKENNSSSKQKENPPAAAAAAAAAVVEKKADPQPSANKEVRCEAPKLSLHGTVELGQVLQALGVVVPSSTLAADSTNEVLKGKGKTQDGCAGCGSKHDVESHHPGSGCKHKYRYDHGKSCHHYSHRHHHHSMDHHTPSPPRHTHSGCRHASAHSNTNKRQKQTARYDSYLYTCCERCDRNEEDWETTSASTMTTVDRSARQHTCHHHRHR